MDLFRLKYINSGGHADGVERHCIGGNYVTPTAWKMPEMLRTCWLREKGTVEKRAFTWTTIVMLAL